MGFVEFLFETLIQVVLEAIGAFLAWIVRSVGRLFRRKGDAPR